MVWFVHVDEGTDRMRAPTSQRARHFVGGAWHKSVRAIAVVKQLVLTDDLRDVGVPGHQPERIKAFDFNATERLIRAKPLKPCKKGFLPSIRLRRGDEASEAVGYFFFLRHPPLTSSIWLSACKQGVAHPSS